MVSAHELDTYSTKYLLRNLHWIMELFLMSLFIFVFANAGDVSDINKYYQLKQIVTYLTPHVVHIKLEFGGNELNIYSNLQQENTFKRLFNASIDGYMEGSVIGVVNQFGLFQGIIHLTETNTYHVEPAKAYNLPFRGNIIYKESATRAANYSCGLNVQLYDFKLPTNRFKRKTREYLPFPGNKSTCSIFIRVDSEFYKQVFNSEGDNNPSKTIAHLLTSFDIIIAELNNIYKNVEFRTTKGTYKILSFKLKRVKIMQPTECEGVNSANNPDYRFCALDKDISNFLNVHSDEDYSDYCLAYTFTARDFNGILGLAYMSQPDKVGGICGLHITPTSTNTALLNGNRRVSGVTVVTTLAHEIGHNLGAPHDPDESECSPGGSEGNYLMYAHATVGYLSNNKKFSKCSLSHMSQTMERLLFGKKSYNCLEKQTVGYCGNMIVEDNEECDCGYPEQCEQQNDKCCFPANFPDVEKRCTLKANAKCSVSQGPCCSIETCDFLPANGICNKAVDGCRLHGICPGNSPKCTDRSESQFPDGTLCNDDTETCISGQCVGSICSYFGLEACSTKDVNLRTATIEDRMKLCRAHCMVGNKCIDTFSFNSSMKQCKKSLINCTQGFVLNTGSICADGLGYCDIFQLCRLVDNEGPLEKLKNIVSKKLISTVKRNWLLVAVSVVILIFASALLVKFCAKKEQRGVHSQNYAIDVDQISFDEEHLKEI